MFGFGKKKQNIENKSGDFSYLSSNDLYFDSACQTLRPNTVISKEKEYYESYNSCGHRVSYPWGKKLDDIIERCRKQLIELSGKNPKDYTVSFGLNTTHGINSFLMQIKPELFESIVTSDIEHNSVFLPSLVWSKKHKKPRIILTRNDDGTLNYSSNDFKKAIVILNSTSNIDGRHLRNAVEIAKEVHKQGGILLLDACQTLGHYPELLKDVDFDGAFGSGHKMYAPSVGFSIIKKEAMRLLDPYLIGGGTVSAVEEDSYSLIVENKELFAILEPGLQNYAGIVGLETAIQWRKNFQNGTLKASEYEEKLGCILFNGLKDLTTIHVLNQSPTSTICFIPKNIDGHQIGLYLGSSNIMVRTGYHCCHYYLKYKHDYKPTVRISIGLHNSEEDIEKLLTKLIPLIK